MKKDIESFLHEFSLHTHIGHKIECVTYGDNVAIECVDCSEILDYEKTGAPRPESYKITKKTADGKTLYLINDNTKAKKAGELNPINYPDLKWSPAGQHLIGDRVSTQTEAKSLAGLLGASWARTGFSRTLNPGDRVYAHNERTKCRYLIFSVNKPSNTDIKMGAIIAMTIAKKFR